MKFQPDNPYQTRKDYLKNYERVKKEYKFVRDNRIRPNLPDRIIGVGAILLFIFMTFSALFFISFAWK